MSVPFSITGQMESSCWRRFVLAPGGVSCEEITNRPATPLHDAHQGGCFISGPVSQGVRDEVPARSASPFVPMHQVMRKRVLYIFLDEAGNFDFSKNGSPYFILGSLTKERPFHAYQELTELKYDLIEQGTDMEYFHVSEDRQEIRNQVFKIISTRLQGCTVDATVVEKRKTGQSLQETARFYAKMLGYHLRFILKRVNWHGVAEVVVITEAKENIFEREAFEAEIDKLKTDRAKADTIINRTKKTITEKMEEDPFLYRKLSQLIEQAIEDYKMQRINDAQLLARAQEVMEQTRSGSAKEAPDLLKEKDLARAFFGALTEKIGGSVAESSSSGGGRVQEDGAKYQEGSSRSQPGLEQILAEAACDMEEIIKRHAVVRWRENPDAQNRMKNDLDGYPLRPPETKRLFTEFLRDGRDH